MDLVIRRLNQPLRTAPPTAPLGICARMLAEHGIRHLPVVDEEARPLGLIDDVRVFRHGALLGKAAVWLAYDPASDRLRAADVMGPIAGRVPVGSSTLRALLALDASDGDASAVVDEDGRIVGLFTEHDAVIAARDLVDSAQRVVDFATAPAVAVDWLLPAHQAQARMIASGIRHFAVPRDGVVVGVISLRDLLTEGVSQRPELVVHDVQRSDRLYSAAPGEPLREAAARMVERGIGCLPVLGPAGELLGILTRSDLLRAVVAALRDAEQGSG